MSCSCCDLHKNCRKEFKGFGDDDARIMVVSGYPGRDEKKNNKLFSDYAGYKLDYLLRKSKLDEYGIYKTSAIKCPGRGKQVPKKGHIEACRKLLKKEIKAIQPTYIVALGNIALEALTGSSGIMDARGYWTESDFGIPVMPVFGHDSCLNKWENDEIAIHDLKKVRKALRRDKLPSYDGFGDYIVTEDIKTFDSIINTALTKPIICFDTETTGLKFHDAKILCTSFSWKKYTGVTVPILGQHKSRIWSSHELRHIKAGLKALFESKSKKVTQNGKFDIKILRHLMGIDPKNMWFDTLLAHHLINENLPHNLTFLGDWYNLNVGRYEDELIQYVGKSKKNKDYSKIPNEVLWHYAAVDVDVPMRLMPKMKKELEEQDLWDLFQNTTMALDRVVTDMEYRGIPLDMAGIKKLSKSYFRQVSKLQYKIREKVGDHDFNPDSPKQLQHYLFDGLKAKPVKKTKSGAYSTDEEVLSVLANEGYEVPEYIIKMRKLSKFRSTYLEGFQNFCDKEGFVHGTYLIFGTRTGRLACIDPNLQNIPRDPAIRQLLFKAPKGWIFVGADYKQIEARLIALYSKDDAYLETCSSSDIHRSTAALAYGKALDDITEEERAKAKSIVFGLSYGRSAESIAEEFEMELDDVVEFMEAFYKVYHKMAAWRKKQSKTAIKNGFLATTFKRRRRFKPYTDWLRSPENKAACADDDSAKWMSRRHEGEFERQAINFPIQSPGGDYLSVSKIGTWREYRLQRMEAKIVLNVHDMYMTLCPESEADQVKQIMTDQMQKVVQFGKRHSVELIPDFFVSKRWEK